MKQDPPANIPTDSKVVVEAYRSVQKDGSLRHHTYKLWIVDSERWIGPMSLSDAMDCLRAEGYSEARIRGKLEQARRKAASEAWRGSNNG